MEHQVEIAPFKKMKKIVLILLSFFVFDALALENIERRRAQFSKDQGYLVSPFPYILPGVGTGFGLLAGINNMYDSHVDLNTVFIQGDVVGRGIILTDIHLIPETVLLDIVSFGISNGQQQRYTERGMLSDPDKYNIVGLKDSNLLGGRLIATFFDRMLEFYVYGYKTGFKVDSIRDSNGELVNKIDNPETISSRILESGILLDYTDDRLDPRRGFKLELSFADAPSANRNAIDGFSISYSATLYFPVLSYSTFALQYYRSEFKVQKQGETDPEILKEEFGCYTAYISHGY